MTLLPREIPPPLFACLAPHNGTDTSRAAAKKKQRPTPPSNPDPPATPGLTVQVDDVVQANGSGIKRYYVARYSGGTVVAAQCPLVAAHGAICGAGTVETRT